MPQPELVVLDRLAYSISNFPEPLSNVGHELKEPGSATSIIY